MAPRRSMTKIAGSRSGSIFSQRHGSADPNPYQNGMAPQHWLETSVYHYQDEPTLSTSQPYLSKIINIQAFKMIFKNSKQPAPPKKFLAVHTFDKSLFFNKQGDFRNFLWFFILLHLPPQRFHCVGGCCDRPRTVATFALAVRRSNLSARSHPQ